MLVAPGRSVLISEPCSWDMDALGFPYLPYLWGVLKTYYERNGERAAEWRWLEPIYRYGDASSLLAAHGGEAIDVLGLSCYTWNWRLQCRLAELIRSQHPDCLIIAGGPHPDYSDPAFFQKYPFIDAVAVQDGEITFSRILDRWRGRSSDLESIGGLYLPDPGSATGHRFTGPAEVPKVFEHSPYAAQSTYYERIVAACGGRCCATWESNRGCPFKCSFCDWGSSTMSKVRRFELARVHDDLDWLVSHEVDVLFLADANFGMLPRDVELAQRIADSFRKYGHPTTLSYNNAKNKPEPAVAISKVLFESGMPYKHMLSLQHTREEVLAASDRKNISSAKAVEVVREVMDSGIPVEVQLILGIPGDTYRLWQGCFGDLMEWGVHGQYQTFWYHLLPNAPAARPQFRARWKMETLERCVYSSPHLALIAANRRVDETNSVVVSCESFSREDWVKMNAFATVVKAFHTTGLTLSIAHYLRRTHGIAYEDFYRSLVDEWAASAPWYDRLCEHFAMFLQEDRAPEFMNLDDVPGYGPVAPFQWLFIHACRRLDATFESLHTYLLRKYPRATSLESLIAFQKELVILPEYDFRQGKTIETDRDWPAYFSGFGARFPLPEPESTQGNRLRVSDSAGSDGVSAYPLDWIDATGDSRWTAWVARVVLDYSCATRSTFQRIVAASSLCPEA